MTFPHLPEHVCAGDCGVQHPLPVQTWLLMQQVVPLQHVEPEEQQTPLQHWVVQLVPGWPLGWFTYEHVLLAPQVPVLQACTAQAPQFTLCPQLLMTLPHVPPAQVVDWEFGVQQASTALQTCPLVQQTPLQHVRPLGQHVPLQHCAVQLLPGWPFA